MNSFSNKNNVLVIDNTKIHHDEEMINLIERIGCKVLFLPPYSPDYNLIPYKKLGYVFYMFCIRF